MRTGQVRALIFIALASLIPVSSIESASAITTGNCSVSVANSTGVLLVENSGNCYLAFSATGANSFVVPSGVSSSAVLVIAGGGGGGGGAWGGGGGAGGVLYSANHPLTVGSTMNISVGAGGAGGAASLTPASNRAANGTNSWIASSSTFVAIGGGAGAGYAYGSATISEANGNSGGSGGGGTEHGSGGTRGSSTQTLSSNATTSYGNVGGNTPAGGYVAGAGGGGAGNPGGAVSISGTGGAGGAGTNAFAGWFTAIGQFGVSGYIAGGGGGGAGTTAGTAGSGGAGVGGGNPNRNGANALANTGSGGGGASYSNGAVIGGAGGSGLVIFKFTAVVLPAVINAPTLSGTVYKGISTTITVTMDSPGKVRFFADDKRIPNCLAVATTGSSPNYSATCSWKANVTNWHFVKAILTPTNTSQAAQTSAAKSVFITKRTTFR